MPGLKDKIARRVRAEGPLSVAAFMAMALHDPEAGYYARRNPLGRSGDFITAPEISQVFGELIGLWCADLWQRIGRPDPVLLVELGPGRGVLMQDLLRAAAAVPDFRRALRLYLVEASPVLRSEQGHASPRPNRISSTDFADVPAGPMLLVANEFLDALPIRQLVRGRTEWAERIVALDPADNLVFAEGPESPWLSLLVPPPLRGSPPGTIVEIGPAAAALAGAIAERLTDAPGAALLIDYGYVAVAPGPTLSGDKRPSAAPTSSTAPGDADLSAHVDFAGGRRGSTRGRRRGLRPYAAGRLPQRAWRRSAARPAQGQRRSGTARRARQRSRPLDRSRRDGQFIQGSWR